MHCRQLLAALLCLLLLALCQAADGKVVRADSIDGLGVPIYQWRDDAQPPAAIVLAAHGLALHATAYEHCARQLAANGVLFVAPDLRGYGRCRGTHQQGGAQYSRSQDDLARISEWLRQKYPGVPLYALGESLGGSLVIRLASQRPELFDGLILAAPAIRHRYHLSAKSVPNFMVSLVVPPHEIDFSPYIRNYFSNEAAVAGEEMGDPLVRKTLSLGEIISSCHLIASTGRAVRALPPDLPLLVVQGDQDLMVGQRSLNVLQKNLPGKQARICMLKERGHILLETSHVHPEVMNLVTAWLKQQHALLLLSHNAATAGTSNGGLSTP